MIQKPKLNADESDPMKRTEPQPLDGNGQQHRQAEQPPDLAAALSLRRRHVECMPMARNTISGSIGTRNITANTGGPTDILPIPSSS